MQNRIPYRISGETSFFSREEIKDILAYLRVITNPDDDAAFLRIVNKPRREIGPMTIQKLGSGLKSVIKAYLMPVLTLGLSQTLTGRGLSALQAFHSGWRELYNNQSVSLCLLYVICFMKWIMKVGYMKPLVARKRLK